MNNIINYLKIYGIKIFIIKLIKYPFVKIKFNTARIIDEIKPIPRPLKNCLSIN